MGEMKKSKKKDKIKYEKISFYQLMDWFKVKLIKII